MCIYTSIKCHTFFCVRKTVAFYPGFPAQFSTFADSEAQHYIHSTAFKCRTFSFDFVPQLVIIWGQEAAGYSTTVKVELMENLYYVQHYNNSSFGTTVGAGKNTNVGYILQWNKTIKFYAGNQSNEYQPNKSNITYNYIAFG